LLTTLKIHSSFKEYFTDLEYKADFTLYTDVISYLKAMHPKFNHYMNQIDSNISDETYALLDNDLNIVTQEDLLIKKIKEGSTIYLTPMIVGGGGKRGGLLAVAAIVGIGIATGGFGLMAGGAGGAAAIPGMAGGGFGSGLAAVGTAPTAGGGLLAGFGGMGGFARSLVGNIAMSLLSSLFTKKPKSQTDTDQSTRENGMFGSLTNSTQSGTPIGLHYGLVRVGGQFISGYIESEEHGKNDNVEVGDKF